MYAHTQGSAFGTLHDEKSAERVLIYFSDDRGSEINKKIRKMKTQEKLKLPISRHAKFQMHCPVHTQCPAKTFHGP